MARKVGSDGVRTAEAIRRNSVMLFAERGYNAVSMKMIGDSIAVQPAALYQYYPSKQHLLRDVLRDHMDGLLAAWEAEHQPDEPPALALERFVRFHIRYNSERPDHVFISYMELRSLEPEGLAEISALRGRYEAVLKDILGRGMASGAFAPSDPHVVAMGILGMITGVSTWYRPEGRLSLRDIEDIYVKMALSAAGREDAGV